MKEMYVPTMDELYLMQDMGSNIYRYLVAKVVEKLILEGVNTPAKGMLKSAYKYLRENYENMTYSEIAEELGRTTKAIGAKAEELGYQKKLVKLKNNGGGSNG